jgi:hypothetical protein
MIHDGPNGDWLADPKNPNKGIVNVDFIDYLTDELNRPLTDPESLLKAKKLNHKYRIFPHVEEFLQELKVMQEKGLVRVSFMSGGSMSRNLVVLDKIILPDGTTALDLATPKNGIAGVFGGEHLKPTGLGPEHRYRERFKKNLKLVNPDLRDVVLIDDIRDYLPEIHQKNMFWIDDVFPYPERLRGGAIIPPTPAMIKTEKNKMQWVRHYIMQALDERFKGKTMMTEILQRMNKSNSITPFTPGEKLRMCMANYLLFLKTR